jgi:apolipoprotein D and lipocalin family protein
LRLAPFIVSAGLLCAPAAAWAVAQPTKPVDLARYAGRWYEIAHVFNRHQTECVASTAEYAQDARGRVAVVETCHTASGKAKVYRPSVRVLDPGTNAKLRLTFFYVVPKDYWVLDHDDDYRWAIVAEPTGTYFWVFARTPDLAAAEKERVIARAKSFGYDTRRPIIQDEHRGR